MNKKYLSLEDYVNNYNLSKQIVIDDVEAYIEYPKYNIIYDKFWLSKSQNMICGPMGVYPSKYPIIFKPIINLYGMSRSFKKINNSEEYDKYNKDGLFWQTYFEGAQICLDIIVNKGKILFYNALCSVKGIDGSFEYHYTDKNYSISKKILQWIYTHLGEYQGSLNLEIIDDTIIEAHLRLNGDFHCYDINFCKQLHSFFESDFDPSLKINYNIPELFLFPIFLERKDIDKLQINKIIKIQKMLHKSNTVKTYYFNKIDTVSQGNLLRIIYFDSYDFNLGLKLKQFILNYIFI